MKTLKSLLGELFRIRRYKANQGRLVRRLTMIGIWAIFISGAYKFNQMAFDGYGILADRGIKLTLATLIAAFGCWFGFRLINWPPFADFLVSVEGEMIKVSWPGKAEMQSSTVVVLVMFVLLSAMIYMFDLIWVTLFNLIGVLS